jgi:hypothetical protein
MVKSKRPPKPRLPSPGELKRDLPPLETICKQLIHRSKTFIPPNLRYFFGHSDQFDANSHSTRCKEPVCLQQQRIFTGKWDNSDTRHPVDEIAHMPSFWINRLPLVLPPPKTLSPREQRLEKIRGWLPKNLQVQAELDVMFAKQMIDVFRMAQERGFDKQERFRKPLRRLWEQVDAAIEKWRDRIVPDNVLAPQYDMCLKIWGGEAPIHGIGPVSPATAVFIGKAFNLNFGKHI